MANILFGVLGSLLVALGWQSYRVDKLQTSLANSKRIIIDYQTAAQANESAIEQCLATNAENEISARRFSQAAADANRRASALAERLYEAETRIPIEAEQFNDDEKLRVLLPDDFVAWLRE